MVSAKVEEYDEQFMSELKGSDDGKPFNFDCLNGILIIGNTDSISSQDQLNSDEYIHFQKLFTKSAISSLEKSLKYAK